MRKSGLLLTALALAAHGATAMPFTLHASAPPPTGRLRDEDAAALLKAEAKRARKAAKRKTML